MYICGDIEVTSDASKMRWYVEQARSLSPRSARTEDLWRRAVEIYDGIFLPGIDSHWVYPIRAEYSEMYLEAHMGLGRSLQARGSHRKALEQFQAIRDIDPYRESPYQRIMECHAALQEKHRIVETYDQLVQLLHDDLDTTPSVETRTLFLTLFK